MHRRPGRHVVVGGPRPLGPTSAIAVARAAGRRLADLVDVAGLAATATHIAWSELGVHLGINPRRTETTMTGDTASKRWSRTPAAAIATGVAELAGPVRAHQVKNS
jgi:hypothetical protein